MKCKELIGMFCSVSPDSSCSRGTRVRGTKKREGTERDPINRLVARTPLYIPPKVHSLSFSIPATARSPSSRLLTYQALIPSFLPTSMADIPDIILKNSDQRTLAPRAVAFQVATMAGISVCCPLFLTHPKSLHTATLVDHRPCLQRPPAEQ